jgi:hypothetical protein
MAWVEKRLWNWNVEVCCFRLAGTASACPLGCRKASLVRTRGPHWSHLQFSIGTPLALSTNRNRERVSPVYNICGERTKGAGEMHKGHSPARSSKPAAAEDTDDAPSAFFALALELMSTQLLLVFSLEPPVCAARSEVFSWSLDGFMVHPF